MKTRIVLMTAVLIIFMIGCKKEESTKTIDIDPSSISFTACNTITKLTDSITPSVRLIGQANGSLIVKLINTEFCCETDSISMDMTIDMERIGVEIIDIGPLTYCFCPHDIEFSLTSLENKAYELTLVESVHAYSRDTFFIEFQYSESLDTTITEHLY